MAVAHAIVQHYDPSALKDNGGYINIGRNWALSLLGRMKFVKRKATTAKAKETNSYFEERKRQFLEDVVNTVQMEEIPADLIIGVSLSEPHTSRLNGIFSVYMSW